MAASAVILDLDGTVWDSFPLFATVLEQERGVPVAETIAALRRGDPIVRLIEARGLSRQRFVSVSVALATPRTLYEGVAASLDRLTDRRVPLGVFTSLPSSIALPIIEALDLANYFVDIVHAVGPLRKPNPGGINRVLRAAGVEASVDVYYIGDQDRDSEAARNAGVSFGWASYGYGEEEPDFVTTRIDHPRTLATL